MGKQRNLVLKKTNIEYRDAPCYEVVDNTGRTLGYVASEGKGISKKWGFVLVPKAFKGIVLYPYSTRQIAVEKLVSLRSVKADTNSITVIK